MGCTYSSGNCSTALLNLAKNIYCLIQSSLTPKTQKQQQQQPPPNRPIINVSLEAMYSASEFKNKNL